MLRRVFAELRPYSVSIVVLLIISLAAIPITLITPLPIKLIVDNVLGPSALPGYLTIFAPGALGASKDYVLWLAIGVLVGSTVLTYLQNLLNVWFTNKIGNRMTLDVRDRLFRQMQRLSIAYHDTKGSADSTYRTLQDAPALRQFGVDSMIPLITSILTLGAMIIVTLYLDWELALIALLVSPFTFLLTLMFRPRLRRGWRKVKVSESAAMAVAQETLGASRVVKAFGQEDQKSDQLISRYSESLSAALKVYVYGAVYNLLVGILTALGLAAVLYIGIRHVQSNPPLLSLGSLLVVNYYVTQLYSPLKNVGRTRRMVATTSSRSRGLGMSATALPFTNASAWTPTFAYTWKIGSTVSFGVKRGETLSTVKVTLEKIPEAVLAGMIERHTKEAHEIAKN